MDVFSSLSDAQTFLWLASASKRTRSEANKTRVVAAIDARGGDFIRGLERYRLTPDPLVNDDQKLMALQNFFYFRPYDLSVYFTSDCCFELYVHEIFEDTPIGW